MSLEHVATEMLAKTKLYDPALAEWRRQLIDDPACATVYTGQVELPPDLYDSQGKQRLGLAQHRAALRLGNALADYRRNRDDRALARAILEFHNSVVNAWAERIALRDM